MYKRIIRDSAAEKTEVATAISSILRIIPADKVFIRSAGIPSMTRAGINEPEINSEMTVTSALSDENDPDTPTLSPPSDPSAINAMVEKRVKEFETRFQEEKERAFKNGYEEGAKRGYNDAISKVKSLENTVFQVSQNYDTYRDELLARSEKALAKLVTQIAEAVIGEAVMKNSRELLEYNLKRCSEVLGGSGKVKIRISPSDYEFAADHLKSILSGNKGKFIFEFEPDPSITPGGCFLETGGGAIDARLESQLDQIKNNFMQMV